jgi:hypothetical protein
LSRAKTLTVGKETLTKVMLLTTLLALTIPLSGANAGQSLQELSQEAVSVNPAKSTAAIAALRAAGPAGLQALFDNQTVVIQRKRAKPSINDAEWQRLSAALDAVARQRDSWASGLYWYTDFERAKTEARASGKPILSLRLLGNLDEEFTCANSRFFRTVLYPNADVGRYLRDHFVLYWQSVRPVPHVTIDFGDGRVLQRTITGNSIHYVLDAEGRVIDALPGLYGPKAFLSALQSAEQAALASITLDAPGRDDFLRAYHRERIAEIERSCHDDADKLSIADVNPSQWDYATWKNVAALHSEDAKLDAASTILMRAKTPDAQDANRISMTKSYVETPLLREVRTLEKSVAEDTVRNEYMLHRTIHDWLAHGKAANSLAAFNERVYAELFLSPLSDPWLGLAPSDAYSALDDGGVTLATRQAAGPTR